jgi:BTB/POZ domain
MQGDAVRILAGYPFDHPNADVILRSSDNKPVDFYVFKLLLTLASPFFELVFSLPQPPVTQDNAEHDIPVIKMAEDKDTLKLVLRFCLPISMVEPPRLSSLHELQMVLKAAMKLEMEGIQRHVRKELVEPRFIESQPLRVFAIAYHYGWSVEARRAARFTLRHPGDTSFIDELELITAATYYRLQEYHKECGEIAASRVMLLARSPALDDDWVWITCLTCNRAGNYSWWRKDNTSSPGVRKWWLDWMDSLARELRRLPWGETVKKWDLMKAAITKAKDCSHCGKEAAEDLESFSRILAVDIEKHISMAGPQQFSSRNTLIIRC